MHQVGAEYLEQRPGHPGHAGSGHQVAQRHPLRGEHPERGQEQAHVDQGGGELGRHDPDGGLMPVGVEAGQQRGQHDTDGQHAEELQSSAQPREVPGPGRPGQVPHLLHGEQPGLSQPSRAPDQPGQAHDQADHAGPAEHVNLLGQLMADQRHLIGHRGQHLVPESRVDRCGQAEDRHQHQQQREQRDETGVGEVRHQRAAVVVAELLHHAEDEGRGREPLLSGVDPPDHPLDGVHRRPPLTRCRGPATARLDSRWLKPRGARACRRAEVLTLPSVLRRIRLPAALSAVTRAWSSAVGIGGNPPPRGRRGR